MATKKTAVKKKAAKKINVSADTGKFVTDDFAKANSATTYSRKRNKK